LDSGFNPGMFWYVNLVAVQTDGKTLVGGQFATLDRQPRSRIDRLSYTAPATQNLSHDGPTINWLRGGTGPEVWRTTFEICTNGSAWTAIGAGSRIPSGWHLAGVSCPPSGTLRARGYVTGGHQNASGWFVETVLDLGASRSPVIVVNDGQFGIRTNGFGFTVTGNSSASVVLESSTNLVQWAPLDTNFFGSGSFSFTDSNSTQMPQRFYRVRVWP
jgi:hypothetical protein